MDTIVPHKARISLGEWVVVFRASGSSEPSADHPFVEVRINMSTGYISETKLLSQMSEWERLRLRRY